jgi:hypothetical protein
MEKEVLMFPLDHGKTIKEWAGKFLCVLTFPRRIKLFSLYLNAI